MSEDTVNTTSSHVPLSPVIHLKTSILRRLMAMAKACPDFAPLVEGNCVDPEPLEQPLAEELRQLTNPKQWLMALHLTCTYLAAKNIDKVDCPLLTSVTVTASACKCTAFACMMRSSWDLEWLLPAVIVYHPQRLL